MRTDTHDFVHPDAKRYRALFVSDLHLGTKACQAEAFLDFLRSTEAERIYLVGDIVDFWRIKRGAYWPQAHNDVLQKLPRGTTVSLWVFGQAVGADKTVKEAEKTIRRVQEPVEWDPSNPERLRQLMAKVQYPALEPWNESPIVRAMLAAKRDLDGVAGFKTLLVITDGMDNRFTEDAQANPRKKDIPTVDHLSTRELRETLISSSQILKTLQRDQNVAEQDP